MAILNNNHYNAILDLLEPAPVLNISERSNLDAELSENYVDMCLNTEENVQDIVNCVFYRLSLYYTTFHFEPAMSTWFCSYFPNGFIAPVIFTIRIWSQGDRILVEPTYHSGHFATYNEIQENVINYINNHMYSAIFDNTPSQSQ